MIVKKNAFIWSLIFIIISISCNVAVFFQRGDEESQIFVLGYILLVELVFFLIANCKVSNHVLNFGMVFIIVLFIFNFGQVIINTYFKSLYPHVRFLLLLSKEDAIFGFKYINLAFSTLCMGLLIAQIRLSNSKISEKDIFMNSHLDFKGIAHYVILLTFPIKLIIDIITLVVSVTVGGEVARTLLNTLPNVLVYWGKISLIGFALLLVIYKNEEYKQNRVFFFIEAYILLMMISGVRSENVGYLLIFAFIYVACREKKVPIPKTIIYGLIGIVLLAFIIAVGEYRNVNTKSIGGFFEVFFNDLTKKNVVFSLLDNLGDTGYTAQCVINKWLPLYGASGGDSYYLGVFSVLPNIPRLFTFPGMITEKSCFAIKIQKAKTLSENYLNIGGSLIGEQFFNFGLIGGVIATFIIGIFLGKISSKCSVYFKEKNYYGLIRIIPIMFATIYWVRDYFGGEFREVIWGPLVFYIIINLLQKNRYTISSVKKSL